MDFNRILAGMLRAIKLDKTLFAELEGDSSYNMDSLIVVLIAAVAGGISAFITGLINGSFLGAIGGAIFGMLSALVGFFAWSFVVYFVGVNLFKGTSTYEEMRRVLGFAYSVQVFNLLGFIPFVGGLIGLAVAILMLIASYYAIRQALNLDTTNTILTIIIAMVALFIVYAIIGVIAGLFGIAGAGLLSAIM